MSDDEDEAIIIGFEEPSKPVERQQQVPMSTEPHVDEYSVQIKEFEKRKESFLSSEVQVYRIDVSYKGKSYRVLNRRFSDMELLFCVLRDRYPGVILPGFPENTVYSFVQAKIPTHLNLNLFEKEEFIGKRMSTLKRFLQKLLNMKELAESEAIQNFLGPDGQYDLYRQSKSSTLSNRLSQSEKKGILEGAIQTASNYFKTKRVDSKYEKFQEAGQALTREIEKLFGGVEEFIGLNKEELKANASLYEQSIDISTDLPTKQFVDKWDGVLEATNRQLSRLIDLMDYMLLDVRMYTSIIEQRYQLKEQSNLDQVQQLERNFEASKDNFLRELSQELARNRVDFQQLIQEQNRRLQAIR